MKKWLKVISVILIFSLLIQTVSAAAEAIDTGNDLLELETLSGLRKKLGHYFSKVIDTKDVKKIIDETDDENSILLEHDNGTKTIYTFTEPVKYKDDDGEYVYKDTIINGNTNKFNSHQYTYSNNSNDYEIGFSTGYRSGVKVRYDGLSYTIGAITDEFNLWSKLGYQEREIEDGRTVDKFSYSNLYGYGTKLSYIPQLNGVKQEIILNKYRNKNEYTFEIITNNCIVEKDNDGYVRVKDTTGKTVQTFSKPFAYDSLGCEGIENEHFTNNCSYEVEKIVDGQYYLKIVVDNDWLTKESTVYPVTIDPTVYDISMNADVPVHSTRTTSGTYQDNNFVGRTSSYGNSRFYTKFSLPSGINDYATINTAGYYARELSGKDTSMYIYAHRVLSKWDNNITYATRPSAGDNYFMRRIVKASEPDKDNYWFRFNIKYPIQKWVDGETNCGIMFKSDLEGGTKYDYRSFASKEYSTSSYRPYVAINYTNDTTKPIISKIAKSTTNWTNGDVKLTITASDADSGLSSKPYKFGSGSWTATNNKTYSSNQTVTVYVRDKAGNQQPSSVKISNIDKTKPVISSFQSVPNGDGTCNVTVTATDASSGISKYVINGTEYTSGTQTISVSDGVVTATVYDKAGNSATKTIGGLDATAPENPYLYEENGFIMVQENGDVDGSGSLEMFDGAITYSVDNQVTWLSYKEGCDIPRDTDTELFVKLTDSSGNSTVTSQTFESILGEYAFESTDVTSANLSSEISFIRKYSSLNGWESPWLNSYVETPVNSYAAETYRVYHDINGNIQFLLGSEGTYENDVYTLTEADSYTINDTTYESACVKITDGTHTFIYVNNVLTAVLDSKDNYLLFTFGENNVVITDMDGNTITVMLNSAGNITSVTDEISAVTTYTYSDNGNLLTVTDPTGVVTESYGYNASGVMITNGQTAISYDELGRLASEITTATSEFEGTASSEYSKVLYTYGTDDNGKYYTVEEIGVSKDTHYYNNQLADLKVVDINGKVTYEAEEVEETEDSPEADEEGTPETDVDGNTVYKDSDGNILKIEYTDGTVSTYEYDEGEAIITTTNSDGDILSVAYPDNTSDVYSYNTDGKLIKIVYADGTEENYAYAEDGYVTVTDEKNRVIREEKPVESDTSEEDSETDDTSTEETEESVKTEIEFEYEYDDNDTCTKYDANGNVVLITYSDATTETFSYDADGNVIRQKARDGSYTYYNYDRLGRLIVTGIIFADSVTENVPNQYSSDMSFDNLTTVVYNSKGWQTSVTENDVITVTSYDLSGRILSVKVVSTNEESVTEENEKYSYTYDSNGNCASFTEVFGTTNYVYNEVGKILKTTLSNGKSILYTYEYGKLKTLSFNGYVITYKPDGSVLSFTANGNPVTNYTYVSALSNVLSGVYYANGVSWNYVYDDNDRLIRLEHIKDGVTSTFTFTYDEDGNLTEYVDNLNGIKTVYRTVTDEDGNETYFIDEYALENEEWILCSTLQVDEENRVLFYGSLEFVYTDNSSSLKVNNVVFKKQQFSDHSGNIYLNKVTKTDGEVTTILYTQEITYYSNGLVKTETTTYANGTLEVFHYEYNEDGRLTFVYKNDVLYEEIQYNNKGYITADMLYEASRKNTYIYDANNNVLERYVYSLAADGVTWTKIGGHVFKYDTTQTDLQLKSNSYVYEYDAMGNLIKGYNNIQLTWNGKWLESFYNPYLKVTATYRYNSYGYRVAKTVTTKTGAIEYHTYTLNGSRIIGEKIVVGNTTTNLTYWYDQNGEVAGLIYNGTAVYTFVKNQYGDVIAIVDANGTKVVTYVYDPYGRAFTISDTSGINIAKLNPFRYHSYYLDVELAVYYLQSRYYYPYNMKFLSPDSPEYLTDQSTLTPISVYAYCGNEPIEYVDPEGNYKKYSGYKIVGFGIQVEVSIGIIGNVGFQFVWFTGPNYKSWSMHVYLYGSMGAMNSYGKNSIKNWYNKFLKKFLKKFTKAKNILKGIGLSASISAFIIKANYKFSGPKDFAGLSVGGSVTAWHVLGYFASFSTKNKVKGNVYGIGYDTSTFGYSATYNYSFYLGKIYIGVMERLKNSIRSIANRA